MRETDLEIIGGLDLLDLGLGEAQTERGDVGLQVRDFAAAADGEDVGRCAVEWRVRVSLFCFSFFSLVWGVEWERRKDE
jgi:hypothetical protein